MKLALSNLIFVCLFLFSGAAMKAGTLDTIPSTDSTRVQKPKKISQLSIYIHGGGNIPRGDYGTNRIDGRYPTQIVGSALKGGYHFDVSGLNMVSKRIGCNFKFGVDLNMSSPVYLSQGVSQPLHYELYQCLVGLTFLMRPYTSRFNLNFTGLLGVAELNDRYPFVYVNYGGPNLISGKVIPGQGFGLAGYYGVGCSYRFGDRFWFVMNAGELVSRLNFNNAVDDRYEQYGFAQYAPTTHSINKVTLTMNTLLLQFNIGFGIKLF
jgi:hypothetical protein